MIDTGNPTWAFIKAHRERGMTEATARLIAGTGSDERERGIILALGGILDLPKPIVGVQEKDRAPDPKARITDPSGI